MSEDEIVLTEFLTNEKPCQFLMEMLRKNQAFSDDEAYASKISDVIDCTYSHTTRIARKMEDAGLITSKKNGRKELLALTESGEEVAQSVSTLYMTLEEEGENPQ